jgi:hypothetical protein
MGLKNFIAFAVSQSVEERIRLLRGGGQVALLYTLLDITVRGDVALSCVQKKIKGCMLNEAKGFDPFNEIFGSIARHI